MSLAAASQTEEDSSTVETEESPPVEETEESPDELGASGVEIREVEETAAEIDTETAAGADAETDAETAAGADAETDAETAAGADAETAASADAGNGGLVLLLAIGAFLVIGWFIGDEDIGNLQDNTAAFGGA